MSTLTTVRRAVAIAATLMMTTAPALAGAEPAVDPNTGKQFRDKNGMLLEYTGVRVTIDTTQETVDWLLGGSSCIIESTFDACLFSGSKGHDRLVYMDEK